MKCASGREPEKGRDAKGRAKREKRRGRRDERKRKADPGATLIPDHSIPNKSVCGR